MIKTGERSPIVGRNSATLGRDLGESGLIVVHSAGCRPEKEGRKQSTRSND